MEENPVAMEEVVDYEDYGLLVDHPSKSTPTSRKRILSPDTMTFIIDQPLTSLRNHNLQIKVHFY